jgi:type I restriction enzyme S subunit
MSGEQTTIEKENIPSGWQKKKLRECAKLVRNHFQPNETDERPYIGLEHIQQQTLRLLDIGKSTDVKSGKYIFKSGDILFGKLRPYFRKVVRPKFDGVCSTDIFVINSKNGTNQGFLYYLMASEEMIAIASKASEGTKMPRASWDYLKNVDVVVPPLAEQRRIATILGALDDKIELNQQMNKTLEEMAAAIFKSWFVDFEPFEDGEFEYSKELGKEIPKGWSVKPLDQIADFLNGVACQKFPAKEGESSLPVIKIRELRDGFSKNSDYANLEVPKKYIIEDGDVLFSWSATLLVKIWCGGQGVLNQHIFKVSSEEFPKWFYYLWTKYHIERFQRIASGKVTTMGHIKRHHLNEALVLVPGRKVFETMTKTMAPVIARQIENEIESRTLAAIRDALLPKLMSGEIRINNPEKLVEASV